jgi:hypothetical protein
MADPTADDELDRLPSEELNRLATRRAVRHLDVGFFWELIKILPAAEAGAGDLQDADADIQTLRAHADDLAKAAEPEIADNLRPFYLDYLRRHGVTGPGE